jgi:hypothetical protein
MTRYPLQRRLGGPQGLVRRVWKISTPPGFDPRAVQPVAIRYTDCASVCVCVGIQLFSVLLCMAGAGHKFDLTFAIKGKPNNLLPVERKSCCERNLCFRQDDYVFRFDQLRECCGLYIRCEGQLSTLE